MVCCRISVRVRANRCREFQRERCEQAAFILRRSWVRGSDANDEKEWTAVERISVAEVIAVGCRSPDWCPGPKVFREVVGWEKSESNKTMGLAVLMCPAKAADEEE